jgi:GGDEF domain-containing protein
LSVELGDDQGVAFADLGTCNVQISMGEVTAARQACENALRLLPPRHIHARKNVQRFLALMDLEEGHPARALASLNEILDHEGADMFASQATYAYRLRARAHAELKQYPEAYADMDEYARRNAAEDAAERDQDTAVQRALFETDRQVAHSLQLQRELEFSREREEHQRQRNLVLLIGGGVSLALLLYIAIASLRHRGQLEKLANYDGLTGLPNRRFAAEFAQVALTKARENDIPLDQAVELVERLREAALKIRFPDTPDVRVRFSAGLASRGTRNLVLDEIIANADAALYEAKKDGRDLTCVDEDHYASPSAHVRRTSRSKS